MLSEHDLGYQMRELLSAAGHKAPVAVPSLELNPEHALVRRLDAESDPGRFERLALLLFEQAVLAEGRQLDDPAAFVARLNELLTELGGHVLEIDSDAALSYLQNMLTITSQTEDAAEGVAAFAEKRAPKWTGR